MAGIFSRKHLRTKILVLPALGIVVLGVVAWAAFDIVASHQRLLEGLSASDLAKTRETTLLHLRLSANHTAVFDLLSDATRGLDEATVYERGFPVLDEIRSILTRVGTLPRNWPLTPTESRLTDDLIRLIHDYLEHTVSSVDRASAAPSVSDRFITQSNDHYRRANLVFWELVEESRRNADAAISAARTAATRKARWLIAIIAAAVVTSVALSAVFARLLTEPVLALARLMERVRHTGDYRLRATRRSSDEVGELVDGFNAMIGKIQGREEELHAARISAEQVAAHTEQLLASIAWILIAVDDAGTVTQWNAAAEGTFGIPAAQALGRPFTESGVNWDWAAIVRWIGAQTGDRSMTLGTVPCTRGDGRPALLTLTLNPIRSATGAVGGFLLLGSDVTGQKALESQLARSQKLESLGQLAAGVAHEINTPIQFIGDNMRFLRDAFGEIGGVVTACRDLGASTREAADAERLEPVRSALAAVDVDYLLEEAPSAIEQSLEGVSRVAKIVRALKEFAHPHGGEKVCADLNQALLNTLTVARNEVKYVADVETELGEIPPVLCYPDDLNQVFLNLIVNAAHAVEAAHHGTGERGVIRIRTAREANTVVVAVSDTGTGIPAEIRDRIFDPFFTTKAVGKGTGQGLAIAHSVVTEKHGGTLTFETEMGHGTVFSVRLPVEDTLVVAPPASELAAEYAATIG